MTGADLTPARQVLTPDAVCLKAPMPTPDSAAHVVVRHPLFGLHGASVISNFRGAVNSEVAALLAGRPEQLCAVHHATRFCGDVWATGDGRWVETVYVHHVAQGSYIAPTLEALMTAVNDDWGWD